VGRALSQPWLVGGAALGALVLGALAVGAAHAPAWHRLEKGLEHRLIEARDVQADLLRFDLSQFDADVELTGAQAPLTAAEAASTHHATAAINGGFFDPQWRPLGMRISHGVSRVPLRPHVDWGVFVIRASRAQILHSKQYQTAPIEEAGIQVGPRLLVAGQPTKLKPPLAYRSALAVDSSGRYVTVISTAVPVDANVLAKALQRLGEFSDAVLLDGGPSAQLFAQSGAFVIDRPGGYSVPDLLVFKRRQHP
jgi:uncharacterized protein YigE (DUF2233 family)